MANPDHLKILKQGVEAWNAWRKPFLEEHDYSRHAELSNADLAGVDLEGADLLTADLTGAILTGANLKFADLSGSYLHGAKLDRAELFKASIGNAGLSEASLIEAYLGSSDIGASDLSGANLRGAILHGADLSGPDLVEADLRGANLTSTLFARTTLTGANLSGAVFNGTHINDVDLRGVKGLDRVVHEGPSSISIDTLYKSNGDVPTSFLVGCGVPDDFITSVPSHFRGHPAVQFYSCFISYSGRDEEFARRLHARMREAELRVWFAPEDMKGGDKIYDQIDRAIQVHDRLLLVLSESSMQSKWVELEIRRARKVELREGRRKLFPIRLVSYEALQEWMCIDSTTGEDLAEEVRSYFIPDFSNWKNHDDFELAFGRLLADLKASA